MNRLEKAAAFGAMMGKLAAEVAAPQTPQPSARDIEIYKARMELQRKGQMARQAAGGNGAPGTSRATMKGGVIQPGATFTPQGQQPASNNIDWSSVTTQKGSQPMQQPLPGAGGQANTPPAPKGPQPVPPASSPVMESKTPKKLF